MITFTVWLRGRSFGEVGGAFGGKGYYVFVRVRDLGVYCGIGTCVYMEVCVKYACVCIHPHTLMHVGHTCHTHLYTTLTYTHTLGILVTFAPQ